MAVLYGNASWNSTGNLSGNPYAALYRDHAVTITAWFALSMFLVVFAAVSTAFLLWAMTKGHKKLTGVDIMVIHQFALELVLCAVFYPQILFTMYFPNLNITQQGCNYWYLLFLTLMSNTHWCTFFLALNRFAAIVTPLYFKYLSGTATCVLMVIFSWIVAFGKSLPGALRIGGYYDVSPPWMTCGYRGGGVLLVTLIGYWIPIVGCGAAYFAILCSVLAKRLSKKTAAVLPDRAGSTSRSHSNRVRLAEMLFGSWMWYLLCYVPVTVCEAFFQRAYRVYPPLQLWTRTILLFGYVGGPMIFFAMNRQYLHRLRRLYRSPLLAGKTKPTTSPTFENTTRPPRQNPVRPNGGSSSSSQQRRNFSLERIPEEAHQD